MTWTPSSTSGSKVTGTLTYTIQSYKPKYTLGVYTGVSSTPNGAVQTISQTLTVPKVMNVGVIGSTGYNYGILHYSNNTTAVTGARGTAPVQVNYINALTGKKIPVLNSSSITANVGDHISISAPGGTKSGNTLKGIPGQYIYSAPTAPAGYSWNTSGTYASKVTYGGSFDSTGKLTGDQATDPNSIASSPSTSYMTVSSTADSTSNPNVMNIYYTPTAQTTYWTFGNAFVTQTGNSLTNYTTLTNAQYTTVGFPASQSGSTGVAYAAPSAIPTLPAGYHYAGVKYYDAKAGTSNRVFWTTAAQGWSNNGTAVSTPGAPTGANNYTGYASITAAVTAAVADANSENGGMLPNSLTAQPSSDLAMSASTPNVFLLYTEADKITANFTFNYASGSTGPALPTATSTSGAYTTAIASRSIGTVPSYTAPAGYTTSVAVTSTNASGTTTTNTYSTLAAALAANPNYVGTTAKPMTFATTVTANQNTVNFTYQWAKGTPGATDAGSTTANPGKLQGSLPTNSSSTFGTGQSLTSMPANWLPAGYGVQSVAAPDGNTYTSFSYSGTTVTLTGTVTNGTTAVTKTYTAASAPNDLYLATRGLYPTVLSATTQNWVITVNALTQKPTLTAKFTSVGGVNVPATTQVNFTQKVNGADVQWTALTGAPIPADVVSETKSVMDTALSKVANYDSTKWFIAHYNDPNGVYTSSTGSTFLYLSDATANVGNYVLGTSSGENSITGYPNAYTVQYDYEGTLSMSVPSAINFGAHLISGGMQTEKGTLTKSVAVEDDRSGTTLPGWKVTVGEFETQSVTNSDGTTTTKTVPTPLTSADGLHKFADASGQSYLQYKGQALSANETTVLSVPSSSDKQGLTTVIPANSQDFTLLAPPTLQLPTSYSGTLTWTLYQVP